MSMGTDSAPGIWAYRAARGVLGGKVQSTKMLVSSAFQIVSYVPFVMYVTDTLLIVPDPL